MPARSALLAGLALTLASTSAGAEEISPELARERLRACVVSGAAGAPRDSLVAALTAVRALCHAQLQRVYRDTDAAVDADNAAADEAERADLRKRARREIDFGVARLVASATGLAQ